MTPSNAFTLQRFLPPAFERPSSLFINSGSTLENPDVDGIGYIPAKKHISGNTYINAFFPDVWRSKALIGRLGVSVSAAGNFELSIFHVDLAEHKTLLANASGQNETVIWLDAIPSSGRLFIQLDALNDLKLFELNWVTDIPERFQPSLSVGLCTFNREADLAKTIQAINLQVQKTPNIRNVWVVNQGAPFTDVDLVNAIAPTWVTVIEQPNLGGCGGFTRSMYEAVSTESPTTHHLLMDDDIILDPRMLEKSLLFLNYANDSVALGGQMLEIENPTRLFEAGGMLHPQMFVTPIGENTSVEDPEGLQLFSETFVVDYNAWWFCVLPTSIIKKVGLPPPLFIRGDDIEYACRIRSGGCEIVPLPGCPVWHESFSRKGSDWLMYYNLRNRIVLPLLHSNVNVARDPLYLLGFLMCLILTNRYRATELSLLAIKDLTADPVKTGAFDSQKIHTAVMALNNRLTGPKAMSSEEIGTVIQADQKPLDTSVIAIIKMCAISLSKIHLNLLLRRKTKLKFSTIPQASAVMGHPYVTATNPEETEFAEYPVRIGQLWKLMSKSVYVCAKYAMRPRNRDQSIREHLETLRHPDHWKKAFNAPRD